MTTAEVCLKIKPKRSDGIDLRPREGIRLLKMLSVTIIGRKRVYRRTIRKPYGGGGLRPPKGLLLRNIAWGSYSQGGGQGVPSDKIHAYMWLALSAAQGDEEAGRQGDILSKQLKPAEMMNAKKLLKQWKPSRASIMVKKIVQQK